MYLLRRHNGGARPVFRLKKSIVNSKRSKKNVNRSVVRVSNTFYTSKNVDDDWRYEYYFLRAIWRCGKCRQAWTDIPKTLQTKYDTDDREESRYNLKEPISIAWRK